MQARNTEQVHDARLPEVEEGRGLKVVAPSQQQGCRHAFVLLTEGCGLQPLDKMPLHPLGPCKDPPVACKAVGLPVPRLLRHITLPRNPFAQQIAAVVELIGVDATVRLLGPSVDNQPVAILQGGSGAVLVKIEEDGTVSLLPGGTVVYRLDTGCHFIGAGSLAGGVGKAYTEKGRLTAGHTPARRRQPIGRGGAMVGGGQET